MKMKLKEVLWEVTNKCNRSCTFCGSKDIINRDDDVNTDERLHIAEEIAMNAEVVTLTGGEPLMLEDHVLNSIVTILKNGGCEVDVVTNGDMLMPAHFTLFRNIGVSVNSVDDIEKLWDGIFRDDIDLSSVVLITNVNKINYFDLENIVGMASEMGIGIQFQLTMYKGTNPEMIDGTGINDLRNKILDLCDQYDVKYVLADNLQVDHECSAGLRSCGVLYNGLVVPCLSMRSWADDMDTQENLLHNSLDTIWRTGFRACRFSDNYTCCRDCFNYPEVKTEPINILDKWKKSAPQTQNVVMLYGAMVPNKVTPYCPPFDIMTYGVTPPHGSTSTDINKTS